MRNDDGTYYVTADEVRAFQEFGRGYLYMTEDGSMIGRDEPPVLDGITRWPLYLFPYQEAFFAQWNGDLERAASELNPVLDTNIASLKSEGRWPPV